MCYLLGKYLNKNNKFNLNDVGFKLQEIVNVDNNNIGYEVLINSATLPCKIIDYIYNEEIKFPPLTRVLISKLESFVYSNATYFLKKYIFINLERSNLCDQFLLCDIAILKNKLIEIDIYLVVEITERNICNKCSKIELGLNFLKKQKVILAVDDYNLESDFRKYEVSSGLYQFIKVEYLENSKFISQIESLNKVTRSKLIIERVETKENRHKLNKVDSIIWGMQGFFYGKRHVTF